MVRRLVVLACAIGLTLFAACKASENSALTREKAKKILETSDYFKAAEQSVALTNEDCDELLDFQLVQRGTIGLQPTQRGMEEGIRMAGGHGGGYDQLYIVPTKPIKPVLLAVTGITDGENGEKIVEYDWNWDLSTFPKQVGGLMQNHPKSKANATLKLYDDGWRIVKIGR